MAAARRVGHPLKTHLFAYGFRPNFLAAGIAAALLVPLWAASASFGVPLEPRWPGSLWHGHEMLFGFVAAAIGGFLLTSVPSWTGERGFGGAPLVALAVLWLLGRLAPFAPRATLASTLLIVPTDFVAPGTAVAGVLAFVAGTAHLVRASRWSPGRTVRVPLVWVLHLGYAWIPAGLLLKSTAILGGFSFAAFWLHALTAGALATLILAVMTRASLGHTGRPLRVGGVVVASYALLAAAALVRVFGASAGLDYRAALLAAATLWAAAFGLFLLVYAPILAGPRVDGKPG